MHVLIVGEGPLNTPIETHIQVGEGWGREGGGVGGGGGGGVGQLNTTIEIFIISETIDTKQLIIKSVAFDIP